MDLLQYLCQDHIFKIIFLPIEFWNAFSKINCKSSTFPSLSPTVAWSFILSPARSIASEWCFWEALLNPPWLIEARNVFKSLLPRLLYLRATSWRYLKAFLHCQMSHYKRSLCVKWHLSLDDAFFFKSLPGDYSICIFLNLHAGAKFSISWLRKAFANRKWSLFQPLTSAETFFGTTFYEEAPPWFRFKVWLVKRICPKISTYSRVLY